MERFSNLPTPLKWTAGVAGTGALLGTALAVGGGKLVLIFVLIVAALMLVLLGGFYFWQYLKHRQQNAHFGSEINQSTTAAPRGMSATDLAKLDNLRKKFQEGIGAFRSRGKDLYALPWYVIVGEPGSGKTEAIRHCNVGFPPGMHEGDNSVGYMGAGGTINMNWWFTNYAVMLDTAGRLMFEEVKPGETSEWREFLKLLRKNRPNCPINGLLLVIPSDSLIKDSTEQIAAKAGKIAQQLDVIQRTLDFRFPVYVVVSKSDKINGFREFFENVTDPQLQHQMMGWSNPDPLDSPFQPEQIDRHLSQVAERLRRRRLGLMRDPVPQSAPRRTDEVDSLYALPNSLFMLAPRLRRYLETIFVPGEWSAKPLFLRGIYFTSSMREGAALDQDLAEAIGVQADELPEGKVWERDRAYFLRDLFTEKVFKEKGLVTRATNVKARLRRNQLMLYSCALAAVLVFVVVGWLGMRTVRAEVKNRSDYWAAAADTGWDTDRGWHYRILRWNEDSGKYFLYTNRIPFAGDHLTLAQIQEKLRELAASNLKGRWTSPGLAHSYNENSKRAQRVIFETGVLEPVLDAVDKRMRAAMPGETQPYLSDALVTLVRLESDILSREKGEAVPMDTQAAENFLGPLLRYATGEDVPVDTNLTSVMAWTYTDNNAGQGAWPPAWMSATTNPSGVATNPVIAAGLDAFIQQATNTIQEVGTNWVKVTRLASALRGFNRAEDDFLAAMPDTGAMMKSFDRLKAEKALMDQALTNLAGNGLLDNGVSFDGAFSAYTNQVATYGLGAFDRLEQVNLKALHAHANYPIFVMVARRLQVERRSFSSSVASLVTPAQMEEFKQLDKNSMTLKNNKPAWERRWQIYDGIAQLYRLAGFPLLRASAKLMTSDEMNQADAVLQQLVADANSGAIQELNPPNADGWKALTSRLKSLNHLADVLKAGDRPDYCTISLLMMDNQHRSDDVWRARYRYIQIAGSSAGMKNTNIGQDEELGKVNAAEGCSFQLYQRDSDPKPEEVVAETDQWGPLALVAKNDSHPAQAGDYSAWIVNQPVPGVGGFLRLKLKFDKPLVSLDVWPKE
jgi:IcmF-related N-terminal domain